MDPNDALPVPDTGITNTLNVLALAAVEVQLRKWSAFEEQHCLLEEQRHANWGQAAAHVAWLHHREEEKRRLAVEVKKYKADLERNEEARTCVIWWRALQRRDEIEKVTTSAKQYEADLRRIEEEHSRIVWDREAVLHERKNCSA
jgi:hypothetical protein